MSIQNENFLNEVLDLLKKSQTPDTTIQQQVLIQLEEILCFPDTNFYLVHILTKLITENEAIRVLSGIVLKNNIRNYRSNLQHEVLEVVMNACLEAIGDPSVVIRRVIGDVISTIARGNEIKNWSMSLVTLFEMMNGSNPLLCDGAFTALEKICEDSIDVLETPIFNDILIHLIPKCLQFMSCEVCRRNGPNQMIQHAIACLRPFSISNGPIMQQYFQRFAEQLFLLAKYEDDLIQLEATRILASLIETQTQYMLPFAPQLMNLMLTHYHSPSEELACAAAEFWLNAARTPFFKEYIRPVLSSLLPSIVRNMRYAESDEMFRLNEDANIPDRDDDIPPRFFEYDNSPLISRENSEEHRSLLAVDDVEEFNCSMRNYSAFILQHLTRLFREECMLIVLPLLSEALNKTEWQIKESGIFAIGAVARGYLSGMEPHFPCLFPHLLNCLSSERIHFRFICCWVFTCHASLLPSLPQSEYLEPLLQQLLQRMQDKNKRVQAAACVAIMEVQLSCGRVMLPYLTHMLRAIEVCFAIYQKSNIICLYDMLRTLADSLKQQLNVPEYVDIFMPILMNKWQNLNDNDRELIPLMMCLRSMAGALTTNFLPFCNSIFPRCIRLIEDTLDEELFYALNMTMATPNKEFKVAPLNLLAKLMECLGIKLLPLLQKKNVVQLVYMCSFDKTIAVKCNAFELLAQLARNPPQSALVTMGIEFFPVLAASLEVEQPRLSISACHALIELAFFMGSKTEEGLDFVLDRFLCILDHSDVPPSLRDAVVLSMACIGYVCPIQVAPYMSYFINQWLSIVVELADKRKQDMSFRGICVMIALNPEAVFPCFDIFCKAIAALSNISEELNTLIHRVCHGIRTQISNAEWQAFVERIPPEVKQRIQVLYHF